MQSPSQGKGGDFLLAALLAPGMAAAIFFLGMGLTESFVGQGGIERLIGSFLLLLMIASCWGAIPSLVFGGLVLALIQRIPWPGQSNRVVYMFGGVTAAGLYVLTGLGIAGLSPGVAMFFAPWATRELWGPTQSGENWWLLASLLLAGACAGLIYSVPVKRG
ncbi:MAG: hypothetical protein K2Y04_15250 [Caulobacteraceae bacterium]|nr:hypothetical protein [Caulobacteraceae bacterium]